MKHLLKKGLISHSLNTLKWEQYFNWDLTATTVKWLSTNTRNRNKYIMDLVVLFFLPLKRTSLRLWHGSIALAPCWLGSEQVRLSFPLQTSFAMCHVKRQVNPMIHLSPLLSVSAKHNKNQHGFSVCVRAGMSKKALRTPGGRIPPPPQFSCSVNQLLIIQASEREDSVLQDSQQPFLQSTSWKNLNSPKARPKRNGWQGNNTKKWLKNLNLWLGYSWLEVWYRHTSYLTKTICIFQSHSNRWHLRWNTQQSTGYKRNASKSNAPCAGFITLFSQFNDFQANFAWAHFELGKQIKVLVFQKEADSLIFLKWGYR